MLVCFEWLCGGFGFNVVVFTGENSKNPPHSGPNFSKFLLTAMTPSPTLSMSPSAATTSLYHHITSKLELSMILWLVHSFQ